MNEAQIGPKPDEREHAELDRVTQRLETMVDILDFKESDAATQAKADLVRQVDADGRYDETNPEHHTLLAAYMTAAEDGIRDNAEPEPAIGYQLALLTLWLRLDDPDRFYDRLDSALDELYQSRLDAAAVEVNAIVADLESLNQK